MSHFEKTQADMTHIIGIQSQQTNQNMLLYDTSTITKQNSKPEFYKDSISAVIYKTTRYSCHVKNVTIKPVISGPPPTLNKQKGMIKQVASHA